VEANLGFLAITKSGARPLSAAVFCNFNGTLMYKYGASDPTALESSPNYVMFWQSIEFGKDKDMHVLDFGKTASDNDGLRFFKNKWKPVESPLLYSFSPRAPSGRGDATVRLAKTIIQRSPLWVCRVVGELLYKHLAP